MNRNTNKTAKRMQHGPQWHRLVEPWLLFLFLLGNRELCEIPKAVGESVISCRAWSSGCSPLPVYICWLFWLRMELRKASCSSKYTTSWFWWPSAMKQVWHSILLHCSSKQNTMNGSLCMSHVPGWMLNSLVVSSGGAEGETTSPGSLVGPSNSFPSRAAFLWANSMFSRTYRFVGKSWTPPYGTGWCKRHSGHCTRLLRTSCLKQRTHTVWVHGSSLGHLLHSV